MKRTLSTAEADSNAETPREAKRHRRRGRVLLVHVIHSIYDDVSSIWYEGAGFSAKTGDVIRQALVQALQRGNTRLDAIQSGKEKPRDGPDPFNYILDSVNWLRGAINDPASYPQTIPAVLAALQPEDRGTWRKIEGESLGGFHLVLGGPCTEILELTMTDY